LVFSMVPLLMLINGCACHLPDTLCLLEL